MSRFLAYRFGGVRQFLGPVSGLSYTFVFGGKAPPFLFTEVADERDAEAFIHQGTPESGTYFFREVDASGFPVGLFPPINPALRNSMIDPKKFPTDQIDVTVDQWVEATEMLGDPWLYYYYSRVKMNG